ncbi:MAG: RNA 3'-terminal phosphate cyclase [Burkholderiaceae bacterium]
MIEIDGSAGEGGGQILRTSLALSMVTGKPFRMHSIRAKRPKPGLMRQHLTCVQAAQAVCGAQVEGAELNSQQLVFASGKVKAGEYSFAVGSAGSCTLVLQTVLPPLLLADAASTIHLAGGTHNPMAPPFHFLQQAFAPLVRRAGADLQLSLRRHGFYPAGGGEMTAVIYPAAQLKPITLTQRGAPVDAYAEALAPGLPRSVPARELEVLGAAMGWSGDQLRHGGTRQNEGPGNALIATLAYEHVTEVFTQFGEKAVSSDEVAKRLVSELRDYQKSHAPVGPHLADQLMLLQALAARDNNAGEFVANEITQHTRTNAQTIAQFLPVRFVIEQRDAAWHVKTETTH